MRDDPHRRAARLAFVLPLGRQLLNQDRRRSPAAIVERLAGMNAQTKRGPVVGMWTRTADYDHGEYVAALRRYDLVRANLMRGTVHLVTRRQYLAWRACLQPVAERMVRQYCPDLMSRGRSAGRLHLAKEPFVRDDGLVQQQLKGVLAV
jgi:Winged helix DNA-binding domain